MPRRDGQLISPFPEDSNEGGSILVEGGEGRMSELKSEPSLEYLEEKAMFEEVIGEVCLYTLQCFIYLYLFMYV